VSFGQQSGPPATAKQVRYLQALLEQAGYASFRDARRPLGLTQRQGSGKFTRQEASALIDTLVDTGVDDDAPDRGRERSTGPGHAVEARSAAETLDADRVELLRGMPASLLADELVRRGWKVTEP
jgi:hypothetical protein